MYSLSEASRIVVGQLHNLCWDFDEEIIKKYVEKSYMCVEKCLSTMTVKQKFTPYHTVCWSIFLYFLSNILGKEGVSREAGEVYYLNKVMHNNDWFYQINLPEHFFAEHPIGSVLGRAKYGDHFFFYQGTTVGGNRKGSKLFYPQMGDNVLMYANSTVLGDCKIGSNVIISAGAYLLNERIPDNCIVFGQTPNIVIKQRDEDTIKNMTSHIWKW